MFTLNHDNNLKRYFTQNDAFAMPPNLPSANCDPDLLHPSCCDIMSISHNMCLPGLDQISRTVPQKSCQKRILWPNLASCDLCPPDAQSRSFHAPAICANSHQKWFTHIENIVFTSMVETNEWMDG